MRLVDLLQDRQAPLGGPTELPVPTPAIAPLKRTIQRPAPGVNRVACLPLHDGLADRRQRDLGQLDVLQPERNADDRDETQQRRDEVPDREPQPEDHEPDDVADRARARRSDVALCS